jgi:hypothetical protein
MTDLKNVEQAVSGVTELTREQHFAREQEELNSITFEQLTANYEEAVATCDSLEVALEHARARREILGAAVDRLNEPQDTKGF